MKVIKDHFFILALLAMFVGFSAFKSLENTSRQSEIWFTFDLNISPDDPAYASEVLDAENYTSTNDPNPPIGDCPQNGDMVCAIKATPGSDPLRPNQAELTGLASEIAQGGDANPNYVRTRQPD